MKKREAALRLVLFLLISLAVVLHILQREQVPEPAPIPQPTPTPLVWEYEDALDFARSTCQEITKPLVENSNLLRAQTDKLLTESGAMNLLDFRSVAWPLEGKKSCWVILVGDAGQEFNFPAKESSLTPHVIPVGRATLVFENLQGKVVSLPVIH